MSLQFWSYCSGSSLRWQRLLLWDWLHAAGHSQTFFPNDPLWDGQQCVGVRLPAVLTPTCRGSPRHSVRQPLRIFSWGCVTIMELAMRKLYCSWSICMYTDTNSFFAAPNMLQKNCLCQYTYRSINCSRVSSSPIPWSLHSLSWISSVVVSPSVLVNHGMLGWVQQGASTPTHCCPSHRGSLGKNVCEWPAAL